MPKELWKLLLGGVPSVALTWSLRGSYVVVAVEQYNQLSLGEGGQPIVWFTQLVATPLVTRASLIYLLEIKSTPGVNSLTFRTGQNRAIVHKVCHHIKVSIKV